MGKLSDAMMSGKYPASPGWKDNDTSRLAAIAIKPSAGTIRDKILAAYNAAGERGLTADEACSAIGVDVLVGRPRVKELVTMEKIRPLSVRRPSSMGKSSKVYVSA